MTCNKQTSQKRTNKTMKILITVIVSVLFAVGTLTYAEPRPNRHFEEAFSFDTFQGRVIEDSPIAEVLVQFNRPAGTGRFHPNVNVLLQRRPGVTLQKYKTISEAEFRAIGFKTIRSEIVQDRYHMHYRGTMGDTELEWRSSAEIYGDTVYLITATATPDQWERAWLSRSLKAAVDSFRVHRNGTAWIRPDVSVWTDGHPIRRTAFWDEHHIFIEELDKVAEIPDAGATVVIFEDGAEGITTVEDLIRLVEEDMSYDSQVTHKTVKGNRITLDFVMTWEGIPMQGRVVAVATEGVVYAAFAGLPTTIWSEWEEIMHRMVDSLHLETGGEDE